MFKQVAHSLSSSNPSEQMMSGLVGLQRMSIRSFKVVKRP